MRERARDIVVDWVHDAIAHGDVGLGDRLPGERELAETLGVSRTAVREALQVLHALGVVRSGVGSGPKAGTILVAEPATALGTALTLHVAMGHIAADHIVEVRVLLEEWAAHSADAAALDAAAARTLLERMADPALDVAEYLRLDAEFHVVLATSSSNPLVTALMGALRESISESTVRQSANLPRWSATASRLLHEHGQILDAYLGGDHDLAAARVRAHILGYYAETSGTTTDVD